jgi:hypothetical protein
VRYESLVVLEDSAVPSVRVELEPGVGEPPGQVLRVAGAHHEVLVAVGNEDAFMVADASPGDSTRNPAPTSAIGRRDCTGPRVMTAGRRPLG